MGIDAANLNKAAREPGRLTPVQCAVWRGFFAVAAGVECVVRRIRAQRRRADSERPAARATYPYRSASDSKPNLGMQMLSQETHRLSVAGLIRIQGDLGRTTEESHQAEKLFTGAKCIGGAERPGKRIDQPHCAQAPQQMRLLNGNPMGVVGTQKQ